jgi:hypothetical protein
MSNMQKPVAPFTLGMLKNAVAKVPEGAALLQLADKLGCAITFDESCAMDGCLGKYQPATASRPRRIGLHPRADYCDLVFVLAHELRHMWQDHVLGPGFKPDLMPLGALLYHRIIEGDAYAFELYFARRLEKPDAQPDHRLWYKWYTDFQATDDADGYDQSSLENQEYMVEIDEETACEMGMESSYKKAFNKAAADELAPMHAILKAGLVEGSPAYAPSNVLSVTEAFLRPSTIRKADRLEKRLRALSPA